MARLYLHCGLCGRKQAEGLLSRAAWGYIEIADDRALRACPTCRTHHADWEDRLRRVAVQGETSHGPRYGGVYRSS